MMFFLYVLILQHLTLSALSDTIIGDSILEATIQTSTCDASFGKILSLQRVDERIDVAIPQEQVWSATIVNQEGETKITSTNIFDSAHSDHNMNTTMCNVSKISSDGIILRWNDAYENLDVILDLSFTNGLLSYQLGFEVHSGSLLSVWDYSLTPLRAKLLSDSKVFDNVGFGVVRTPGNISNQYPQSTLQFLGVIGNPSTTYVGAHDPSASSKTFRMNVDENLTFVDFQISATLPDAGVPIRGVKNVSYPIVLSVLRLGSSWYDLSMLYRSFVVQHAEWTKRGRLLDRMATLGSWVNSTLIFVNSHWQGLDIFNTSDGDPSVVSNRVLNIKSRFNLSNHELALHYYEWDTLGYEWGSNYSKCESEISCGFDTHYPDYFPTRQGFSESLRSMQAHGVRVAPYINGRIFDQATETWNEESKSASAKQIEHGPALITDPSKLELQTYNESYGSKAVFAVMCPHTSYWQNKIFSVVQNLTQHFDTDGVYIDQIAAAGPKPCFDSSHGHPLGGGNHWVTGYANMLEKIQDIASKKMILTESNAEPFMSGVDIFLTLVGYLSGDLPGTKNSDSVMVPSFQSIYGGFVITMGAEFYRTDFDNPDVFAAKIAAQFVFGSILGWFSLGGRTDVSGSMRLYELLMSPTYDDEIFYLKRLALARRAARDFMVYGRSGRGVDLIVNGTSHQSHENTFETVRRMSHSRDIRTTSQSFPDVMSGTWISPFEDSLCVVLTTVKRSTWALVSSTINMTMFEMKELDTEAQYGIFEIPLDGTEPIPLEGRFSPEHITFEIPIGVRDVRLLWIRAVA